MKAVRSKERRRRKGERRCMVNSKDNYKFNLQKYP
jgi:hypothetical protein